LSICSEIVFVHPTAAFASPFKPAARVDDLVGDLLAGLPRPTAAGVCGVVVLPA